MIARQGERPARPLNNRERPLDDDEQQDDDGMIRRA
jgi:hypothetical protein